MKRVKLIVAYDGTDYHGWQVQPNGITVEAVLNETLTNLLKEPITVTGASRTDAGVHSLGNVAVFDTNARMPADRMSYALNQWLPDDIVIQDSCEVPADFHPRFCDSRKTYEYRILNRTFPDPILRRNTYFYYRPLDVERMQEAARALVGRHDFKGFCSARSQVEDTTREIYELTVHKDDRDVITIRVTGSGFLYNMVRIIAGTLIDVGIGETDPGDMPQVIDSLDRNRAGQTAPACGLTMIGIEYC